MNNKCFKLRGTKGVESTYDRIGEICYWGRHYVYKDYLKKRIYDKEKRDTQGENTINIHHIWDSIEKGKKTAVTRKQYWGNT